MESLDLSMSGINDEVVNSLTNALVEQEQAKGNQTAQKSSNYCHGMGGFLDCFIEP